jgi:hypothetical protein
MPNPNIGDAMEAYAKEAEEDARKRGIVLDYSEASLEQVDRILGTVAPPDGVLTPQSPAEEDELWTLAKRYGGYVGQVVIKQMGGNWELQDFPNGGQRVVLRCCGIQGFPPEKIYKRLTEDRFSGVGGYCRVLRAVIEHSQKNG